MSQPDSDSDHPPKESGPLPKSRDNNPTELTDAEKRKFIGLIVQKGWKDDQKCPLGHMEWVVSDHLVTPVVWKDGSLRIGGIVYPHVTLTCGVCGYTMFFNAITLGLLKQKQKPGEDQPVQHPVAGEATNGQ